MQYDASGIRSLKRTNDVADTDYIAANGSLGRLLIRYRTTRNGDWRELREMLMAENEPGRFVSYTMGALQPTLASRSSGSAATGAAGVRGLNDGVFPPPPAAAGRGAAPAGPPATAMPMFHCSRGTARVGRPSGSSTPSPTTRRFRARRCSGYVRRSHGGSSTRMPDSGKKSPQRGEYGLAPGAFTRIEFAPVKTMAMRIEATMAAGRHGQHRRVARRSGSEDRCRPRTRRSRSDSR